MKDKRDPGAGKFFSAQTYQLPRDAKLEVCGTHGCDSVVVGMPYCYKHALQQPTCIIVGCKSQH